MEQPPPAASGTTRPAYSPGAYWLRLFTDHILPGSLCVLAAVAQAQIAFGVLVDGPPPGAHGQSHLWLAAQKGYTSVFYVLVAYLFTVRAQRIGPRAGLVGSVVALAGTFVLSLQGFLPTVDPSPERTIPSVLIMSVGMVLVLFSLLNLGRFFGVFPEARGLAKNGPYRYVRHPLYLAEIIIAAGAILPALSPWTFGLLIAFVVLQYARAILEERALTAAIPEYAEYKRHTWRIIPGIH
jgi:protein-S-isoprenylcysteine O-methyltransferase Ste14